MHLWACAHFYLCEHQYADLYSVLLWVCACACVHVCVPYVGDIKSGGERGRDENSFDVEIAGQKLY